MYIEAGGFHAGDNIRSNNIVICDPVLRDKVREGLTGQSVSLRFCEDILGYNLYFRHKIRTVRIQHKCSRPG